VYYVGDAGILQKDIDKRGRALQPLWQAGHCFASNLSGVTRNMLLHWMHTRCRTVLETGASFGELFEAGELVLALVVSVAMGRS